MGKRKCRNRKPWVQRKTTAPAPTASSSAPPPPWIELPADVTANILQRLGAEGMLRSAQHVCSTWWKVCKDPAMWRVIDLCNPDSDSRNMKNKFVAMCRKYAAMCRRAVDRSQGQLDLTIDPFGDGEPINYAVDLYHKISKKDFSSMCHRASDHRGKQLVDLTIDSFGNGKLNYIASRYPEISNKDFIAMFHHLVKSLGRLAHLTIDSFGDGKLINNVANRYHEISNEDYTAMCRHAVDRSQGQLVDLTIDSFGDGELINYVADRSRNLKRLKLVSCNQMFGGPLVQAVEKFEQLEELHLTMIPWISAHQIEAIGNSCPKLKSFSYNERGSKHGLSPYLEDVDDDDIIEGLDRNVYAVAIGKCMPNLHHLQLFAHDIDNYGLEAILDGCPRLESLDIRQCFRLSLGGDLGKRCREQIKDVRLPKDSVSDVPWLVGEPSESDYECWGDYDDYNYYEDCEDNDYYDN